MDGNSPRRGPARRVVVGLLLVGLAATVAIASTGSVPDGAPGVRRPSAQLLDVTMSLLVVVILVGGVGAFVAFVLLRRDDAVATAGRGGRGRGPAQWLGSLAAGAVLAFVALRIVRSDDGRLGGDGLIPGIQGPGGPGALEGRYEPEFVLWPVLLTLALCVVAVVAIVLERRARLGTTPEQLQPQEALADVLDETLDDLRSERDPRRAVIAAYARMERALAAAGMPRADAEAPEEYLARVVDGVDLSLGSAGRLTALFAWARFSVHDVQPEMKDDAIETLEGVRDELRAAAARREALEALAVAQRSGAAA